MSNFKCNCEIETGLCENCKQEWDIDELEFNHGLFYCPLCLPEI